eukprot:gene3223-3701_t
MRFESIVFVCCVCLLQIANSSSKKQKKTNIIPEQPKPTVSTKQTHPKLKEYNEKAHLRPTKCQVCRILVTELGVELNKTAKIKDTLHLSSRLDDDDDESKKIVYHKSEIRLMEVLERVCENTKKYKSIAGPEFPYLTGVKSMFQTDLENMMGKSGLNMKLDAPQDVVDDPTMEIKRLFAFCNQMVEVNEEDIENWYMNHAGKDPLDFICAEKVLKGKDTDCLRASTEVPDYATKPLPDNGKRVAKGEL